jgi:hypothetical protein
MFAKRSHFITPRTLHGAFVGQKIDTLLNGLVRLRTTPAKTQSTQEDIHTRPYPVTASRSPDVLFSSNLLD